MFIVDQADGEPPGSPRPSREPNTRRCARRRSGSQASRQLTSETAQALGDSHMRAVGVARIPSARRGAAGASSVHHVTRDGGDRLKDGRSRAGPAPAAARAAAYGANTTLRRQERRQSAGSSTCAAQLYSNRRGAREI